jgi:hypothetical protein
MASDAHTLEPTIRRGELTADRSTAELLRNLRSSLLAKAQPLLVKEAKLRVTRVFF